MATPFSSTERQESTPFGPQCIIDYNCKLGHGAFGIVYKAKTNHNQIIAAKVIDCHSYPREAREEAKKSLRIRSSHPNIVDIFDVVEEDNKIVLFMEYCPQGNMATYLENQNLPTEDKIKLMVQIAAGIEHLHLCGIIHRDIKPQNILVREEATGPVAKLNDFGISKIIEPDMSSTMNSDVGTHAFKAPEFWQKDKDGKLNYKKSVDIFAGGLTFWAMLQLDARQGLKPRNECPSMEPSEKANDIGYTMSVRMKHNQPIPNIVAPGGNEMEEAVRQLIRDMIQARPDSRETAAQVHSRLQAIVAKYCHQ